MYPIGYTQNCVLGVLAAVGWEAALQVFSKVQEVVVQEVRSSDDDEPGSSQDFRFRIQNSKKTARYQRVRPETLIVPLFHSFQFWRISTSTMSCTGNL